MLASDSLLTRGRHGTNNELEVLFLFGGSGVRPHAVPRHPRHVDIAPTIAHLLDIESPAGAQGRVLTKSLVPARRWSRWRAFSPGASAPIAPRSSAPPGWSRRRRARVTGVGNARRQRRARTHSGACSIGRRASRRDDEAGRALHSAEAGHRNNHECRHRRARQQGRPPCGSATPDARRRSRTGTCDGQSMRRPDRCLRHRPVRLTTARFLQGRSGRIHMPDTCG